jgi:uncharacterized surface protein with fasciclin (FAS1) repeats
LVQDKRNTNGGTTSLEAHKLLLQWHLINEWRWQPMQISGFRRAAGAAAIVLAATTVACDDTNAPSAPVTNLVETAAAAGSFSTLIAAVQAAGLEQTLASGGPFTVFAPTDAAFAALPAGTLDALLQDPDALRDILLYHVVSGEVLAAQVVNLTTATTLQGSTVTIDASNGVKVNDATVVQTDVLATNGVIHVIDKVLIPGTN